MTSTFHYVAFRAFAQATEDVGKVRQALLFAVSGSEAARPPDVKEMTVEGHHKNAIVILEVELKGRAAIDRFFARLAAEGGEAVPRLRKEIDQRLDEGQVFYFRVAKQDAYLGRLALATDEDAIQVRAKVAAFPARLDAARASLDAYLSGLHPHVS